MSDNPEFSIGPDYGELAKEALDAVRQDDLDATYDALNEIPTSSLAEIANALSTVENVAEKILRIRQEIMG